MIKTILLVLHIAGGTAALIGAAGAMVTQALRTRHRRHVVFGRVFVAGMLTTCAMSLPLAYLIGSVFLALIGVFSGYLTVAGWRLAKNRRGLVGPLDWTIHGVMAAASVVMVGLGLLTLADQGVVLVTFGAIGLALSVVGGLRLRRGPARGRNRISQHVVLMFAGAIAAVTAFLVVNGPFGIADWFLPTVLFTPVGVLWSRKARAGRPTTLDRSATPVTDG